MTHPWEASYGPGVRWDGAIDVQSMTCALERAASKWPDHVAVEFQGSTLTFAALNDMAGRIASGLQTLGVVPRTSIALHLPNSPHFVACFFGVLLAGGRAVPLSPELPERELHRQLTEAEAAVLITLDRSPLPSAVAELRQAGLRVIRCRFEDFVAAECAARLDARAGTARQSDADVAFSELVANDGSYHRWPCESPVDEVAVLQFTGGTSGEPKAAMLTHGNFSVVPHAIGAWTGDLMNDTSRVLVVLPLHHVFGLVVMQVSIAFGMRMVLHLGFNSERVLQAISQDRITILFAVPTMYAALVAHPNAARHDLSSLRLCGSGGAPLANEVLERFRGLTGLEILEGYSLTEITDIGTWQPVGRPVRRGSVGLPLPHALVEIVDLETGLNVLPPRQIGEVCFRGPQVMQGYWRRPDETAAALRGGRLHSGDIGYLDDDGYLVLVDRKKNMILSGGANVFPGRIERAIEQHPAVLEVCVIGTADEALGEVAKAFIVLKPGSAPFSYRDLRQFLADRLAAREMPVAMEIRHSLPRTLVGKLSKRALIESLEQRPTPGQDCEISSDPRTGADATDGLRWRALLDAADPSVRSSLIREAVREEIARVLSLPDAGSLMFDTLLTESGVDSLMAVELRNALASRFNVALPGTLAFDQPTPDAIATYLHQRLAEDASGGAGTIDDLAATTDQDHEGRLVRLSDGQQRLWFLDRLAPATALYNLHAAWRIRGALDLALLRRCVSALARRHQSARTQFVVVHGEPRALVLAPDDGKLDLAFVDLRGDADGPATLERLSHEHRTRPFDLTSCPLWRVAVLATAQDEYVLLLTQHHIISDALSVIALFDELIRLYRSGADDHALPQMRLHYSDYVRWQEAQRRDGAYLASLAWWKQQLARLPRLDLPECRPAPTPSHVGQLCEISLSQQLSNLVKDLARREGFTLFNVLLSAWAYVLGRHSGQREFPVGSFVGGRGRAEFTDLVGFFANTVVIRCDLSGNPTFRELLHRIRGVVVDVIRHHQVPFDAVVREVGATQGQDLNPLIQTCFNLVSGLHDEQAGDCAWEWLDASRGGSVEGTAKFNITLTLIDDPAGIKGTLEYASEMFEPSAVERLAKHFEVVLGGVAANPGIAIERLPLLSEAERVELLRDWNRTERAWDRSLCIHEAVASQAARRPGAIAVRCGEQSLSYGELERRSNRLARALRAMGMPPAARVGICLDRSCELIVALLAILKAGASYVPLDPCYPLQRLTFMLDDAEVFALLTTTSIAARWPDHRARVLRLDADAEMIERQSDLPLEHGVATDSLAYVIYTSGSTGRPKGVEITHAALQNTLAHFAELLEVTADDVLLAVTSLSFDIAALEIFMPLMRGATIRLLSREQTMDGALLARELDHATIMQATPATWRLLFEAGWQGSSKLRALCGGEPMPWPLALQLLDRTGAVWNCYGPTETTVWSTTWRVQRDAGRALLGRGIANTRLYVLDRNAELVPVGIYGELYIAGASVGRGYLAQNALSAERFRPDPYSSLPGARMYRTGDKVRWNADGNLEFIGRFDHQIKLRGFRIELGEIEAVLAKYAGVRSCVVTLQGSADTGRLVAYYVSQSDQEIAPNALQAHLERTLPFYMVPAAFVRLAELPLTPNNKIDRNALPRPEQVAEREIRRAPSGDLQRALAGIWRDLLEVEADVRRSFFEQGGTSLQIVRLQHLLRERLGIEISIAELMTYPSIEALAGRIEQRKRIASGPTGAQETAPRNGIDERRREIEALSAVELSNALRARLDRRRADRQASR